jgi:hypothetical protein
MRKLMLDPDELRVESFGTAPRLAPGMRALATEACSGCTCPVSPPVAREMAPPTCFCCA